jgi:hypothetical protein
MNLLFQYWQGFLDGQRPLARPLPIKDNTAQKDGTNIYALSGISTHDPSNEAVKTPIISLDRINEETSPVWFEVGTIFLNIIKTSKYYSDVLRLQRDKYVALSQHLLFLSLNHCFDITEKIRKLHLKRNLANSAPPHH